jgi:hypothetical protein
MSSMVREHRQKLRKKYGVQFLLDALRTHYRLGWRALADVGGPAQQRLVWGQDDVLPQLTCLFPHPTPPRFYLSYSLAMLVGPASPQRERPLAADDLRTVQTSLLGLVREFLVRNFSVEDMQVVLNFLAATGDDGQVGWRLGRVRLG